ncbi:uncharacterized protein F5Z01DRAFT_676123 [Emericellopsis atlantica]|uniref:Uncharacterized protein n=1 Tax=Emericellopsis atlantica TaxID=2614577 RepID=A0A9P8CM21_9HYPO|nr:uncharacterized protein F5Z01DRAFT_676123 [Emericellopsis atlantica]KAG9252239.1 hypothetical protein F5Z01DRAFT_676123 [Emericellopsis atlantica]
MASKQDLASHSAEPPSDAPPSYLDAVAQPPPPPVAVPSSSSSQPEPPSYDTANPETPAPAASEQLLTLILHGTLIHTPEQPTRPLYHLNRPPVNGLRAEYSIFKDIYRLSSTAGQGRIRGKERHLYDFYSVLRSDVQVIGKAGPAWSYRTVEMTSSTGALGSRWMSCVVKGRYEVGRSKKARLLGKDRGNDIEWKDTEGNVVAVEVRTPGDCPRLEMRRHLEAKELDLVVTCWAARVFRECSND